MLKKAPGPAPGHDLGGVTPDGSDAVEPIRSSSRRQASSGQKTFNHLLCFDWAIAISFTAGGDKFLSRGMRPGGAALSWSTGPSVVAWYIAVAEALMFGPLRGFDTDLRFVTFGLSGLGRGFCFTA